MKNSMNSTGLAAAIAGKLKSTQSLAKGRLTELVSFVQREGQQRRAKRTAIGTEPEVPPVPGEVAETPAESVQTPSTNTMAVGVVGSDAGHFVRIRGGFDGTTVRALVGEREIVGLPTLYIRAIEAVIRPEMQRSVLYVRSLDIIPSDRGDEIAFHRDSGTQDFGEKNPPFTCSIRIPVKGYQFLDLPDKESVITPFLRTRVQIGCVRRKMDLCIVEDPEKAGQLILGSEALGKRFVFSPGHSWLTEPTGAEPQRSSESGSAA